jgi:hypothetical protein
MKTETLGPIPKKIILIGILISIFNMFSIYFAIKLLFF